MNRSAFKFPTPIQPMQHDGERYTSGIEGPIQREHYHRYLFALRYCVDKSVLDVASGEGYGSFLLEQVARNVIGVDIDQKAVDFANKNYMSERVSYRRGDAAKLPIEDQSVDVVVSFETIEHFADQADFVAEIDRVLRPGGLVIMSSPNREIYSEAQNYQNPFHVHEMNKQEFVDLLGFRFPHIRLLQQGAVLGSVILPLPGEHTDNVEGFTTRDGRLFERLTGVPGAPYFIALAARAPFPAPPQSILHSDFYHEQIERRFAAIEQVRQEQAAAHSQQEKVRGIGHLIRKIGHLIRKSKKMRILARDYLAVASSPFLDYGVHKGRAVKQGGVPSAQRLTFAPLKDQRQPILVICHEASRTGAPILGWNLIRDLRKKGPVVTLLMSGGVLEEDFAAESDVVVGPLTYEEWHPAEAAFIAERLVQAYQPLYAVANSIETSLMIPPLATLGVPSVALVHEFACHTRPLEKLRSAYGWATHIVFPAQVVANSSYETFPGFEKRRGIHVLAQGRQLLPGTKDVAGAKEPNIGEIMRSADENDKFIVLGAGSVHLRKGVDLFLSAAASARRLAPGVRFKFIWVGDGYRPDEDLGYSVYLREQINKSDLQGIVVFLEPVADFEPAYRAADVFLMSSRLDPQPNVGVDAVTLGLPTVCFAGACGMGEVLAGDPETRSLVVPHLDVEAAAQEICRLANDPEARKAMRRAVVRVGRSAYNAEVYATQIDMWGREAAASCAPWQPAGATSKNT